MSPLSRPVAERVSRTAATLILFLGAVPVALPFVWLVLFLLGPALMPKWRSPAAEAAAPPAAAVPARRGAAA